MAAVRLDAMLREYGPRSRLTTSAPSVEGLLDELEDTYPRLRFKLRDETGTVRRFVKIFVNGVTISQLAGLGTPLESSDEVDILHSIQGG